jgi:DNA-binding CsgD family transcriptional regulator
MYLSRVYRKLGIRSRTQLAQRLPLAKAMEEVTQP